MFGIRWRLGAATLAGIFLGCSLAFGQAPAPAPAEAAPPQASPAGQPSAPAGPTSAPAATSDQKSLTITSGSPTTEWKRQEGKAKVAREKGKGAGSRFHAKE